MLINRRWLLLNICILSLFLNPIILEGRPVFEKGDAIYREGAIPGSWLFGHAGVYWKWFDSISDANPDDTNLHWTIESLPSGVKLNDFENFYNATNFWSVRTWPLSYIQRQNIVYTAIMQIGSAFNSVSGYKNPGVSFRCDGLVEYCYENSGIDIIPGDTWWSLNPRKQMNALSLRSTAEVEEVKIEDVIPSVYFNGEYHVSGMVTIKAQATDSVDGSGITNVEFWLGLPDDTPYKLNPYDTSGIRIGIDAHDMSVQGIYFTDWDTTSLDDGTYTIYSKAFDQAGNTKISISIHVVINNTLSPECMNRVSSLYPNDIYSNRTVLSAEWDTRPPYPEDHSISYAKFDLYNVFSTSGGEITGLIHWESMYEQEKWEVVQQTALIYAGGGFDWDCNTLTWNNKPPVYDLYFQFLNYGEDGSAFFEIDISPAIISALYSVDKYVTVVLDCTPPILYGAGYWQVHDLILMLYP